MPATAPAIAALACVRVTPGPASRSPRTNTISPSTLGAMSRLSDTVSPSRYSVDAMTGP
jgi:hypothetical protein